MPMVSAMHITVYSLGIVPCALLLVESNYVMISYDVKDIIDP
jgi:hypothetical protein